jgi:hypothetical protein
MPPPEPEPVEPPPEDEGGDIVSPDGFIGSLAPEDEGGVEDEPPNDEEPGAVVLAGQRLSEGFFLHSVFRAFLDMGFGLVDWASP